MMVSEEREYTKNNNNNNPPPQLFGRDFKSLWLFFTKPKKHKQLILSKTAIS